MNVEWMVIRGSGVVAFSLLAISVIWGLALTTKVLGSLAKAKPLTWFHESLAVGAVLATIVHMVALSIHDYIPFGWADILIPGRSGWRPVAVAFGVVGFYGLTLISVSFYLKRWIGQRMWRALHFGSFGVFVAIVFHGILAGTDSSEPWMMALYLGSSAAVAALLIVRLTRQDQAPGTRPAPAPAKADTIDRAVRHAAESVGRQWEPDRDQRAAESLARAHSEVATRGHGRPAGDVEPETGRAL